MKSLKEFFIEHLEESKIFEMALDLRRYKDSIENVMWILMVYIILIMLAREENSEEFVKHWKGEVEGFINQLAIKRLKVKDTYESRCKHIENIFYDVYELDTDDGTILLTNERNKLYEEGYDIKDKDINKKLKYVWNKFQNQYLDELIDVIAERNSQRTEQFVNKL